MRTRATHRADLLVDTSRATTRELPPASVASRVRLAIAASTLSLALSTACTDREVDVSGGPCPIEVVLTERDVGCTCAIEALTTDHLEGLETARRIAKLTGQADYRCIEGRGLRLERDAG